ncbi:hypothetical protein MPER_12584, partial [Moniliophthora perniciosa FA553]
MIIFHEYSTIIKEYFVNDAKPALKCHVAGLRSGYVSSQDREMRPAKQRDI